MLTGGVKRLSDKVTFDCYHSGPASGEIWMRYMPHLKLEECQEVYRPSDDTFLMLECIEVKPGERVLEMGCGSGFLSVHMAAAGAEVTAADINPSAVTCTEKNALRNGLKIKAMRSDLFSDLDGIYDLIIFNPPYLPVEDKGMMEAAWAGGEGGLEVVERFLEQVRSFLAPHGRILILVSSRMDERKLGELLRPFDVRALGAKSLFFEKLAVLELTPKI